LRYHHTAIVCGWDAPRLAAPLERAPPQLGDLSSSEGAEGPTVGRHGVVIERAVEHPSQLKPSSASARLTTRQGNVPPEPMATQAEATCLLRPKVYASTSLAHFANRGQSATLLIVSPERSDILPPCLQSPPEQGDILPPKPNLRRTEYVPRAAAGAVAGLGDAVSAGPA